MALTEELIFRNILFFSNNFLIFKSLNIKSNCQIHDHHILRTSSILALPIWLVIRISFCQNCRLFFHLIGYQFQVYAIYLHCNAFVLTVCMNEKPIQCNKEAIS